jgi:hypothetical protein
MWMPERGGRIAHKSMNGISRAWIEQLTFARAFLQFKHAFRVTDSGTLLRLEDEVLLSEISFSPRARRGSDPVLELSGVA